MLKIVVSEDKKKWGTFYIQDDATKEWIEKNVPPIIRAIQLLAGKIEMTGY